MGFCRSSSTENEFLEKWIKWILQCITTVSYSVLINGESTSFFNPKAGLRQGDPLSSYIFILCMEALSTTLSKAQEDKMIHGIRIARSAPSLSHLFFVDDALFFFKGIPRICWKLKEILSDFCEKSGELKLRKINTYVQPKYSKKIQFHNVKTLKNENFQQSGELLRL